MRGGPCQRWPASHSTGTRRNTSTRSTRTSSSYCRLAARGRNCSTRHLSIWRLRIRRLSAPHHAPRGDVIFFSERGRRSTAATHLPGKGPHWTGGSCRGPRRRTPRRHSPGNSGSNARRLPCGRSFGRLIATGDEFPKLGNFLVGQTREGRTFVLNAGAGTQIDQLLAVELEFLRQCVDPNRHALFLSLGVPVCCSTVLGGATREKIGPKHSSISNLPVTARRQGSHRQRPPTSHQKPLQPVQPDSPRPRQPRRRR